MPGPTGQGFPTAHPINIRDAMLSSFIIIILYLPVKFPSLNAKDIHRGNST